MSGMSSYSGASSSPHPPPHPSSDSVLSSSSSGVSAPMTSGMMSSTEGSGGDAGAASSSSGAFGAASGCSSSLANQLGDPSTVLLTKKRLQDLVKEIDPTEVLDDDVEDVLLQVFHPYKLYIINYVL